MKPKYKIKLEVARIPNENAHILSVSIRKKCISCPSYHFFKSYTLPIKEFINDITDLHIFFKVFNEGIQETFKDEKL